MRMFSKSLWARVKYGTKAISRRRRYLRKVVKSNR